VNNTVALAGALHEFDERALRELIEARVTGAAGIRDWFDLADALQTPASIAAGLARLPRAALVSISTQPSPQALALCHALALEVNGQLLEDVTVVATTAATSLSNVPLPVDSPGSPTETAERATRERALTLISRIDELLDLIDATGLRAIARGGISAGDITRVAASIGDLPGELSGLVSLLAQANLVARTDQHWHCADLTAWQNEDPASRWLLLAQAWLSMLPAELRAALKERRAWGAPLREYLDWQYPLDNHWLTNELDRNLALADLLGLSVESNRSELATLVIDGRHTEVVALLKSHIPAHIDSVMLQSDLTIIAPGPLRPHLEAQLRLYALVESRSLASTYRLNPGLISRAMDEGATAESIEAFLASISSTGIPQPVAYLIADIGKKHGSIRVRPTGAASIITCSDEVLARRVNADSNLTVLELTRDAEDALRLSSVFDASVVMRNLLNAKYPAVLENETGEIQRWIEPRRGRPVTRNVTASPNTTSSLAVVAVDALIERLMSTPLPDAGSDEQWLTRQIEVAIRLKSTLQLTVALPDGSAREFTIEPRALNNGRLRALDKRSEVERTIPLSSISSVQAIA
jgi:hypothetical protein